MREEMYLVHSGNMNGRQMEMSLQSATVGDPVAHTMLIWTGEKTKIAMRMELPSLTLPKSRMSGLLVAPPPPPPPPPPLGGVAGSRPIRPIYEDAPPPNNNMPSVSLGTNSSLMGGAMPVSKNTVHTEDLGKQSIEGVLVTGKRTRTSMPIAPDLPGCRSHPKMENDWPAMCIFLHTPLSMAQASSSNLSQQSH